MEELTFRRLLALVNSALWNNDAEESLFTGMDSTAWDNLYRFAVKQGVMAIAFDEIMHLPRQLQPSSKLRMTWALGTEKIERKYRHIHDTATGLSDLFCKEHIDMLVFKGLSLSGYYPVPAHREFGDIDIYLFEHHDKGDKLMADAGAKKKDDLSYKHTTCYYKGVMIENHAYFLSVRDSHKMAHLNQVLLDMLEERKGKRIQEDGLLYPSPDFTALFFILHAIKHLSAGPLPLRTYCDWALFLQANAGELNIERWKKELEKAGLLEVAGALTSLAFRWIKTPSVIPFPLIEHPGLEESISKEMLYPPYPPLRSKNRWRIFLHKCKSLNVKCKRYISIYGGNPVAYYISRISFSVLFHIRYPHTIFAPNK